MQEREELVLNPVPKEERVGWLAPLFNMLGSNIAISELMVGGTLILGMTLSNMIITSIIGNLILVAIIMIQGYIGYKEGLNTYVLAKGAFGEIGGKYLISLLLGITSFGWFGVQAGVAGLSVQKIFPSVNLTLVTVILGLFMVVFALYGFKAFSTYGVEAIYNYTPQTTMSMVEGLNIVVGLVIVGAIISPDQLRYTRRVKDIWIISFLGLGIISLFQQVAAGVMSMGAPTWDITEVLANLGFGWVAFVILILASWSTNVSNAYSGGLALKTIFPNVKRNVLTLVAGLIGTIIAATGIIFKFQSFLSFLGIAVPAIAGIMWCEYYFIQGRTYKHREGINWIAVISWLIGFAASYYSSKINFLIPPINGIVVSMVIYYILMKCFGIKDK